MEKIKQVVLTIAKPVAWAYKVTKQAFTEPKSEPAIVLGGLATIAAAVTTWARNGDPEALSLVPLVLSVITRFFVSPAETPGP